jgi:SAM-dependent methyltransferase
MSFSEKYFNQVANKYQNRSLSGIWSFVRDLEATAIMKSIEGFSGMTCLEFGCGAGYYTDRLVSLRAKILVAVDISENMLKQLADPSIKKVRGDIQNVRFDMKFDRILCAGTIEFLESPDKFFINMKAHLSSKGKAVLLFPRKGVCGALYKVYHRCHKVRVKTFKLDKVEKILNDIELKIENIYTPTPAVYVISVIHK